MLKVHTTAKMSFAFCMKNKSEWFGETLRQTEVKVSQHIQMIKKSESVTVS